MAIALLLTQSNPANALTTVSAGTLKSKVFQVPTKRLLALDQGVPGLLRPRRVRGVEPLHPTALTDAFHTTFFNKGGKRIRVPQPSRSCLLDGIRNFEA